jgi:hypothetical protein
MEQSRRKLKRIENLLRNIIKICSPLGTGGRSNSFCRVGSPMIAPRYILHTGSLAEKGALWAQLWWSQVTSFSKWLYRHFTPQEMSTFNQSHHMPRDITMACEVTCHAISLRYASRPVAEVVWTTCSTRPGSLRTSQSMSCSAESGQRIAVPMCIWLCA